MSRRPTTKIERRTVCPMCERARRNCDIMDHGCCRFCDAEYGDEYNLRNIANNAHWYAEDHARGL